MRKSKVLLVLVLIGIMLLGSGCSSDADVASQNLSQDAEMFRVTRRIVFYNAITDTYMMEIIGNCSIDDYTTKLTVTCKLPDGSFRKHYQGLSDNTTYFVENLSSNVVSTDRYRVIFKPTVIIPDIELGVGN